MKTRWLIIIEILLTILLFARGRENGINKRDYTYTTDSYSYHISKSGKESISIVDKEGNQVEVLSEAGTFTYWVDDKALYKKKRVRKFDVDTKGEYPVVTVTYDMNSSSGSFTTEYTLYDSHIGVKSFLNSRFYEKDGGILFYSQNRLTSYEKVEKRTLGEWVFPENGDFPYLDFESMAWIQRIDDTKSVYTFYKGDEAQPVYYFENYSDDMIPISFEGEDLDTSVELAIVFCDESDQNEADTRAVFASRNLPVSVRFDCAEETGHNVMLYTNNELSFELQTKNLVNDDSEVDIRWQIYDYYGNCISDETEEVLLKEGEYQEKEISLIAEKSGIYYALITAQMSEEVHKEVYTFGVMPEYEYQYRDGSPFGISGVRFGKYQPNEDTIEIARLLGISNARVGIGVPEYVEEDYTLLKDSLAQLQEQGVRIHGQYLIGKNWTEPIDALEYQQEVTAALEEVGSYLSSCEAGNEPNLYANLYGYPLEEYISYFNDVYVAGGYKAIHDYGLPYLGASVYQSETLWLQSLEDYGILEKQDALVTHAYSFPYSPDLIRDTSVELSFESAMIRTRNYLDSIGDKTWYLNECGMPTTPLATTGISSGVDLRTQADYMARELLLALSYGADEVDVYSLFDQQNLYHTILPNDMEDNFGIFYQADFYGRIMPKPSALAYASITRLLEGEESVVPQVTGSDEIRAFRCEIKDTEDYVLCAWSTTEHLSNDDISNLETMERTPNLPWNCQWSESKTWEIAIDGTRAECIDLMGNVTELDVVDGKIQMELTGAPIFVCVKK